MIPEQFAYFGAILNSIGGIIYLVATIRGTVQPNRVTFLLWALASLVAFGAQIQQGVGPQAFIAFSTGFMPLLIFTASFVHKDAVWKLNRFDYVCGLLSFCGILLWIITRTGNVAIVFSILADALAALPTIIKSYKAPDTENRISYFFSGSGGLLALFTITTWNFATYGYPFYTAVINYFIFSILYFGHKKQKIKGSSPTVVRS